jgi:hypothetical protein
MQPGHDRKASFKGHRLEAVYAAGSLARPLNGYGEGWASCGGGAHVEHATKYFDTMRIYRNYYTHSSHIGFRLKGE